MLAKLGRKMGTSSQFGVLLLSIGLLLVTACAFTANEGMNSHYSSTSFPRSCICKSTKMSKFSPDSGG